MSKKGKRGKTAFKNRDEIKQTKLEKFLVRWAPMNRWAKHHPMRDRAAELILEERKAKREADKEDTPA